MKEKTLRKKLTFKKQTITDLDNKSMNLLRGGITATCYYTCEPKCNSVYTCDTCEDQTEYLTCRPCTGTIC